MKYIITFLCFLCSIGSMFYGYMYSEKESDRKSIGQYIAKIMNRENIGTVINKVLMVIKVCPDKWKALMLFNCLVAVYVSYCSTQFGLNFWAVVRINVMAVILTGITVTDFKHNIIPNIYIVAGLIIRTLIFIPELVTYEEQRKIIMLSSILGLIITAMVLLVLVFISRSSFGMGDVKILMLVGYTVGLRAVFFSMTVGMVMCMVVAIYYLCTKKKGRKDAIAFGPYIFWGYAITIATGLF